MCLSFASKSTTNLWLNLTILIMISSVLATLYLPYIHCPSGSIPIVQRFQKFALGRLKAASSMVAFHVRNLNSSNKIEEEVMVGM